MSDDCHKYVQTCRVCQIKARITYRDRVPIRPIPRADRVFFSGDGQKPKYNYAIIAVDSFSRFPFCVALKSLTAKAVCEPLLKLWQFTGCCTHI